MAKKKGFKRFLITIITIVLSLVLIVGISGLCIYNFIIIPKYNSMILQGEKDGEKLSNKDIITFAKYLTDKQFITNLSNIDTKTAKDVLGVMLELEEEIESEATPTPVPTTTPKPFIKFTPVVKDQVFTQVESSQIILPTPTPAPTPAPTPFEPPKIPEEIEVPKKHQSAYDRIMAAATKEEIQVGMAIIAKVDMSKVNALNTPKTQLELKRYIKSVLSSSEISTALKLYRKYKHLL